MSQFCRSILILNILGEFFCQRIFNLFYMRRLVVSSVEIVCDMFSEKWIHLGFPCQHQYLRENSITPLAHFSLTSLLHFLMTFCVFEFWIQLYWHENAENLTLFSLMHNPPLKKCVETKCVRCLSSIWMIGVWQTEVLCSWSR